MFKSTVIFIVEFLTLLLLGGLTKNLNDLIFIKNDVLVLCKRNKTPNIYELIN